MAHNHERDKVSLIVRGKPVTDMLVSYIHGCAAEKVLIMPRRTTGTSAPPSYTSRKNQIVANDDDKALLFRNIMITNCFNSGVDPGTSKRRAREQSNGHRNRDRHADPLNCNHRPGSGSGFGKRWRRPVREENSS